MVELAIVKVVEDEVDSPAEAEDEVTVDEAEEWVLAEVAFRARDLKAQPTPDLRTTRHRLVKSDIGKHIKSCVLAIH